MTLKNITLWEKIKENPLGQFVNQPRLYLSQDWSQNNGYSSMQVSIYFYYRYCFLMNRV